MLSSVATSLAQLTPLPSGPEDAPRAGASRGAAPRAVGAQGSPARAGAARTASTTRAPRSSAATSKARSSAAGYAQATSSASKARSSSAAKKSGPLAFLDDPKLSIEEKLLKLLAYLNDKWNKDLDRKMKEFKDVEKSGAASPSASPPRSSSSSLFKKVASFASAAMPALGLTAQALKIPAVRGVLSNVAGPALAAAATAMGQPALAPLALKYGPDLVDLAANAAASLDGGGGSTSSPAGGSRSSSGTTTKETADGLGSDRNAQLKLMEMQRILDQQKEMFSLVSNMLRTTHETRMAVIQNIR